MANVKRVSPAEAKALVDQGWVYVDVRSEPEFEESHPSGSENVPLLHMGAGGMTPNPEFMDVMTKAYAKDAKLVIGCKAGGRSLRAATMLLDAGYTNVVDQRAGFDGARDAFGSLSEKGWSPAGLPTEKGATPGATYADVKKRLAGGRRDHALARSILRRADRLEDEGDARRGRVRVVTTTATARLPRHFVP